MPTLSKATTELAVLEGEALVTPNSPLTRLNYFDGKILRADDFNVEQRYFRTLTHLSNQAGGAGVVHGYDASLVAGDRLRLGEGLAIDPAGRILLLSEAVTLSIAELIETSSRLLGKDSRPKPGSASPTRPAAFADCEPASPRDPALVASSDLYVVWLAHAEDFCGHEDVYGSLCEQACSSTIARRYIVEGVLVLVTPLQLELPPIPVGSVAASPRQLRSRVASAFFARERLDPGSLISRAGILGSTWCSGARLAGGQGVPVAVIGRAGAATTFLDVWTARRERMEAPAKNYWAGRMAMRPWSVYLAHILQFQCQLPSVFHASEDPAADDPCADKRVVIGEAAGAVRFAREYFATVARELASIQLAPNVASALQLGSLSTQIANYTALDDKLVAAGKNEAATSRVLIAGGIVELPSAGYLPVLPSANVSVNEQVTRLLGEGVDLRFCAVRADYIPHALEQAQHMDRISLLDGLVDRTQRPRVDVLVPDGELLGAERPERGKLFAMNFALRGLLRDDATGAESTVTAGGAARAEVLPNGASEFYFAGVGEPAEAPSPANNLNAALVEDLPSAVGRVLSRPLVNRVATVSRTHILNRIRNAPEPPTTPAQPELEGLAEDNVTAAEIERVHATWFEARVEIDPFDLRLEQTSALQARWIIVIPSREPRALDLLLNGQLYLRNSVTNATGTSLSCMIVAQVTTRRTQNGRTVSTSNAIHIPVTLHRQSTPGPRMQVEGPFPHFPESRVQSLTTWNDDASKLRTLAAITLAGREASGRLQLDLDQEANVAEASHPRHTASLHALDVLEAVLNDTTFRPAAERRLFPSVPEVSSTLIRARRDWVLFHRRREKNCGEPERQPEVAQRRYRVFLVDVTERQAAIVMRMLLANNTSDLRVRELAVVQFASTGANLTTPQTELLAALGRMSHGPELLLSAVCTVGTARSDGDALTFARLKQTEAALVSALPPDPNLLSAILPEAPRNLSVEAADGVIILGTDARAQPTTVLRAGALYTVNRDWQREPRAVLSITNDVANVDELSAFASALRGRRVNQVILFSPAAESAGAQRRVKDVAERTQQILNLNELETLVEPLTDRMRASLRGQFPGAPEPDEYLFFNAAAN